MDDSAPDTSREPAAPVDQPGAGVAKALFVRLTAQEGKGDDVDTFLRDGLEAVMEEHDTTTWYAVRFGQDDFAIFDTFPDDAGRRAHLAGKVGRALAARAPELFASPPEIEHAQVLAYKLPGQSGQVSG
ncbi:putative quinol monooxygenase [Roseococcus sp. YIM B11640]|uniref:putative quinol monooxygenase n=1 Tax=Roseococcus sp. YIM B11640 TaxID=3133973 RepID=UPI003C7CC804